HGYLASQRIQYGSPEALDFTDAYFRLVTYHAIRASHRLAVERGETFEGFEDSDYASGARFNRYVRSSGKPAADAGLHLPTREDWIVLRSRVMRDGMYNAYLQAIPPTGSISYINHSTASLHPVASRVEIRKEGKLGRVYFPAPHMDQDNLEYFQDAYEIGYRKIIDTYAAATPHVDQGLSLTLFFTDEATTRDINRAQIYAWRSGIKTLYYIRLRQAALNGTEVQDCVSCSL
ncbi:MAG: ribonucleotide-diphosphate reductase subunit alpha, partial [Kocuria sp.]|nr:ribonucleotide-diphosphate reductase subunit alpha [Kocuria sp.]